MVELITEILMLTINWTVVLYPAIVYYDATRKRIGYMKGRSTALNFSAGGWATASLFPFIWWIGLLAYCIKRRQLIKEAQANPIDVPRGQRASVLLLLSVVHFALMYQASVYPSSSELDYQNKKAAFWASLGM